MNRTTPTHKPSRLPLVWAIVVAVAGLAAAGVFFSQSRGLQARLDVNTRELERTKVRLDDTTKELQQTQGELARVQASLTANQTRLAEASRQLEEVKSELEEAESQVSQLIPK